MLTAHRAKGLEWDVVVVAGVQEEVWPDLRLRGSLLGADELAEAVGAPGTRLTDTPAGGAPRDVAVRGARGPAARGGAAAVLRRVHPRAAAARGDRVRRRRAGQAPVAVPRRAGGRRHRRSSGQAPRPGGCRCLRWSPTCAGRRRIRRDRCRCGGPPRGQLARLAEAGVRGADPGDWYALTELSDASAIVDDGERVRLSPSHVETFTRCGLRWLLESAVGAGRTDVLRHLGTVIHAAAQLIADGATEQQVAGRIDEIWHHLDFGSVWYGTQAAGARRADGPQVPRLAHGQPAGAARHRGGAPGPGGPGGDHRPGGPARARRRRAAASSWT